MFPIISREILPVIDLMHGQVVRGRGGRRDEYRALQSQVARSANPSDVATGLRDAYGFSDVYVADLDAIAGARPDWASHEAIGDGGLRIWLDAGLRDHRQARELLPRVRSGLLAHVVVGLESLDDVRQLPLMVQCLTPEVAVFSLDLKQGRAFTKLADWRERQPLEIVDRVVREGVSSMIILDLSRVGMNDGPATVELCRQVRDRYAGLRIISGGGARNWADCQSLIDAGCDRVLIASALHDGALQGH